MTTDEKLTAWLDGELPQDEVKALEQRVAQEPDLGARLTALEIDRATLTAAFDQLAETAPAFPEVGASAGWLARLARPVAAVAVVVLAVGAGYLLGNRPPIGDWRLEVAHYQFLYVPDTLNPLRPDPERLAEEFIRAENRVGRPFDQAALSRIDGLTLRRAQVLGFQGRPLIQIAFSGPDGTPIAFCITDNVSGQPASPENASLLELASETWQDKEHSYLVIGGDDPERIARYAAQIRESL